MLNWFRKEFSFNSFDILSYGKDVYIHLQGSEPIKLNSSVQIKTLVMSILSGKTDIIV
jgi:hypothetical protein